MKIIGTGAQFCGGKDSAAGFLKTELNRLEAHNIGVGDWRIHGFARAVKKIYMDTFNVSEEFIEEWKRKDEIPPGLDMPVRQGLQFIGDGFRKIQSDVWIQMFLRNVGDDNVLCSDVRYINEAKAISEKNGYNILIWRPFFENNDPNPSESQIKPLVEYCAKHFDNGNMGGVLHLSQCSSDPYPDGLQYFNYFLINRGTLEDLEKEVSLNLVKHIIDYYKETV